MPITRREFINATTAAGLTALADPLKALATPFSNIKPATGFELIILGTNWGFGGSLDEFCSNLKKDGYDGAELWCPSTDEDRKNLITTFSKYNLRFGLLVGSQEANFDKHFHQFETSLNSAATLKPLYINCHSGRDHFSFEQNKSFIDLTTRVSRNSGVPVYHETHRSRILYSAPVARQFMDKIPELRLTLDISHWCNVHESLLTDQMETVSLALSRTGHIHARIGHPEGPQVNDPRAPEWKNIVEAHFNWWDKIAEQKKKEGKQLTILTEFGPADYMPTIPYTRQPVANQWEINVHMLKTLRARYS
ncbi:MAG TPA: sugar phosphate isomerase/epimerase [Cyclobacteriaceae bacterium]|nr:sugar phosphate isomerase/epimerase [Cyclobacteriaceae bacterium]